MFSRLNISVVFYSVSWNVDLFFDFFISRYSWQYDWFSINNFIRSINELRLGSDVFVQDCWLSDDSLSDWQAELFVDDFWLGCDFLS